MAKGRKPDALAQSHNAPQELFARPLDAGTGKEISMPDSLRFLPAAEECWHVITDGQTRFSTYEVPLLEQYCIAYAAAQQAIMAMTNLDTGALNAVERPVGETKTRKNPNWSVWNDATNQMRHLSGILGLDTLTAERLNLTRAATTSIAADIPAKIRAAVRAELDGK